MGVGKDVMLMEEYMLVDRLSRSSRAFIAVWGVIVSNPSSDVVI